ncbi:MAG: hypothetical protein IT292_09860 [Deltaproteobacteria bacterium]|nr:hypothetical protein [Deltaproteobacteria bacterium]
MVEIANTLTRSNSVNVKIYTVDGEKLLDISERIYAFSQIHLNTSEVLGNNSAGYAAITPRNNNSALAQSVVYNYGCAGRLNTAYAFTGEIPRLTTAASSFNHYLEQKHSLVVINSASNDDASRLTIYPLGSNSVYRNVSFNSREMSATELSDLFRNNTLTDKYGPVILSRLTNHKIIWGTVKKTLHQ